MPGGRIKERKNGQIVLRVSSGEHIQVITKMMALMVEIPSNVTVWLTEFI